MSKHLINPKNLNLITKELFYRLPSLDITKVLKDINAYKSIFHSSKKSGYELFKSVFQHLGSSRGKKDHILLFKLIEELLNNLYYQLNVEEFKLLEKELTIILLHNELFLYKNKIYTKDCLHYYMGEVKREEITRSLELYLKMKIVVEADYIDDIPYEFSSLSLQNNTLYQIMDIISDLYSRDLIGFGGNTSDDFNLWDKDDDFNFKLFEELDNSPEKLDNEYIAIDTTCFNEEHIEDDDGNLTTFSQHEAILKEINTEIEKYIYDDKKLKLNEAGMDIIKLNAQSSRNENRYYKQHEGNANALWAYNFYPYSTQKQIVIKEILNLYGKYKTEQIVISFNSIKDPDIDLLRTVCALEYEGLIEILQIGNYKIKWSDKDDIFIRLVADTNKLEKALVNPSEKIKIADPHKTEKVFLKDIEISFNLDNGNENGELILGTKTILFGKDTNQYYVCKFMFEQEPKKHYSWDEIYESIAGIDDPEPKQWKKINNAVSGINEKVKLILNTNDELLTYKNKGVIRNYSS
jgi:hypothetical protein